MTLIILTLTQICHHLKSGEQHQSMKRKMLASKVSLERKKEIPSSGCGLFSIMLLHYQSTW